MYANSISREKIMINSFVANFERKFGGKKVADFDFWLQQKQFYCNALHVGFFPPEWKPVEAFTWAIYFQT